MRDRLMMPEEDSYASMVAHFIGIPLNEMNCEGYLCRVPCVNPQTPLPEPIGISDRSPSNDFTKRCADLCLAGGVAMNSVINGKISQNTPFKNIYVPPGAADSGTAIGAAFYVW